MLIYVLNYAWLMRNLWKKVEDKKDVLIENIVENTYSPVKRILPPLCRLRE